MSVHTPIADVKADIGLGGDVPLSALSICSKPNGPRYPRGVMGGGPRKVAGFFSASAISGMGA
jgi:hypothetical protein